MHALRAYDPNIEAIRGAVVFLVSQVGHLAEDEADLDVAGVDLGLRRARAGKQSQSNLADQESGWQVVQSIIVSPAPSLELAVIVHAESFQSRWRGEGVTRHVVPGGVPQADRERARRERVREMDFSVAKAALGEVRGAVARNQNPANRLLFRIADARTTASVRSLSRSASQARARSELTECMNTARKFGFLLLEFEVRLALAEIDVAKDTQTGERRLASLEKEAQAHGFGLISRKTSTMRLTSHSSASLGDQR